ncbi:MAG: tRNA pseudouridine(38-40) synthase TruA [Clostridia bacterium]|nr:tRNA pseudouridine(38-40) synthase TruA [Clostridia bacterium]
MRKKILIKIAYDGSNYNGWQRQPDIDAIENIVEKACKELFKEDVKIMGASRTDKGVHAKCQLATFEANVRNYKISNIARAITSKLPDDIIVYESVEVNSDFHVRYNRSLKTYIYTINNAKINMPMYRKHSMYVENDLCLENMKLAAKEFLGTYDFKAFCAVKSSNKDTIRTITNINLKKHEDFITLTITGNGFLHNMVRIITGTLIDVGKGKKKPEDIKGIIESLDRKKAGPTAKAEGLLLYNIEIEGDYIGK